MISQSAMHKLGWQGIFCMPVWFEGVINLKKRWLFDRLPQLYKPFSRLYCKNNLLLVWDPEIMEEKLKELMKIR